MNLTALTRPDPTPAEGERIRRETAVLYWRQSRRAAGDVARAFGVTRRTLHRWAEALGEGWAERFMRDAPRSARR